MNTWRIEALVPNYSGSGRHWTEIDSGATEREAKELRDKYRATGKYIQVRIVTRR